MDTTNETTTAKPLPTPRTAQPIENPDDAPTVRRLDCRHYNTCLDVACCMDWPGFTCNGCTAYGRASEEQDAHDRRALLELILVAQGGNPHLVLSEDAELCSLPGSLAEDLDAAAVLDQIEKLRGWEAEESDEDGLLPFFEVADFAGDRGM